MKILSVFTVLLVFVSVLSACKSKGDNDAASEFSSNVQSNNEAGVGDSEVSGGINIDNIFGNQDEQSSSDNVNSQPNSSQTSGENSSSGDNGVGDDSGSSSTTTNTSSSSSSSTSSFDYNDKNIWTKPV